MGREPAKGGENGEDPPSSCSKTRQIRQGHQNVLGKISCATVLMMSSTSKVVCLAAQRLISSSIRVLIVVYFIGNTCAGFHWIDTYLLTMRGRATHLRVMDSREMLTPLGYPFSPETERLCRPDTPVDEKNAAEKRHCRKEWMSDATTWPLALRTWHRQHWPYAPQRGQLPNLSTHRRPVVP